MKDWEQKLLNPFKQSDVEWRVQQCGISKQGSAWCMVIPYITARACQDRLDDVLGMDGWQDQYDHIMGGVKCTLRIQPPGTDNWVIKTNGSQETQIESFKGGFSKSFVRTCVNVGIGRYLYKMDTFFAQADTKKQKDWEQAKTKERKDIYWKAPILPAWALPTAIISDKLKDFNIENFFDNNNLDDFNALKAVAKSFKLETNPKFNELSEEMLQYVYGNQAWFVETFKIGDK